MYQVPHKIGGFLFYLSLGGMVLTSLKMFISHPDQHA